MPARSASTAGQLARLGFVDTDVAARQLSQLAAAGLDLDMDDLGGHALVQTLAGAADPQQALHRLSELFVPAGDTEPGQLLRDLLATDETATARLIQILGFSDVLARHLQQHLDHVQLLQGGIRLGSHTEFREVLLTAVAADPQAPMPVSSLSVGPAHDALRVAYRRELLAIAGIDLTCADAPSLMPAVSAALADLAAAALDAALAIARSQLPDQGAECRLAIIAMGKCGGRELNYVSDVDVLYVVAPADQDAAETKAIAVGTKLAAALARACSAHTAAGTLWPVDAGLRPEGKDGPLVRTLPSYQAYYERWAHTWEFQALLKARAVAGDVALGEQFVQLAQPLVWQAAQRENFVTDVQAMRRRVEEHIPASTANRQIKLGAGGLRDVEFSVQLLQLVHGRGSESLRTPNTLAALEKLSTGGFVGRDDAAELDAAYRFLRTLEHRLQLPRLQRTQVLPSDPGELQILGRAMGFPTDSADTLEQTWRRHALVVRQLHEKLFYRPVMAAAARLSSDEITLSPQAATARLAALGYRDPAGAMRHLQALTDGVSRRAAIQRQLLPVMLGWFADGVDPDEGLLAFRQVSDDLGSTHWYLQMLRDSGAAAQRMAQVLASSRFVANNLHHAPEMVATFGESDDQLCAQPQLSQNHQAYEAAAAHHEDLPRAISAVRALRRREIIRTAIADVCGVIDLDQVGRALSAADTAAIAATAGAVSEQVARSYGGPLPIRLLVVALGRLGGQENGYASDADVMFAYQAQPDADPQQCHDLAMDIVTRMRSLLGAHGNEPALVLDPDLRPEGRNGALVRSLDSYRQYYERWSLIWEAQALLRAIPIVGEADMVAQFTNLIDPIRWPAHGLSGADIREIRRIKARVESERLPRGVSPQRHLKLGRGALADVEWTVQLLQLQHAHQHEGLRTTSTMAALQAAAQVGLVRADQAQALAQAWRLASRIRNAAMVWAGRPSDVLPNTSRDMQAIARLVGYGAGEATAMEEDYQRLTRHSRSVVEQVFYGQ